MTGIVEAGMQDEDATGEVEVLQHETVVRTKRALLLQAKADEMRSYFQLAQALSKTSMVKDCYQWNGITDAENNRYDMKPVHDLAGAMMYGAKLGIDPEDAGQMIIMIKGQPSLQASDMVGLVRAWCDKRVAHGRTKTFAEGGDWIWEVEATQDRVVWAARRDGDEKSCEWTMARADNAGYTDDVQMRSGGTMRSKYKTIPIEMLRARCQSEIARLMFKDVLRGLAYSSEELQLEQLVEQQVTRPVPAVQGGKGMAALGAAVAPGSRPENHPPHHQAAYTARIEDDGTAVVVEADVVPADKWAETRADEEQAPPPESGHGVNPDALKPTPPDKHGLTALHTVLGEAGFAHRSQKLGIVGALVGRTLDSTNELTNEELGRVNHQLQQWNRDGDLANQGALLLRQGGRMGSDTPAPSDAPERATTKELQALRKAYKDHLQITGKDMLPHLSNVLGWNVTDINALTADDVAEAIRVAEGKASRG